MGIKKGPIPDPYPPDPNNMGAKGRFTGAYNDAGLQVDPTTGNVIQPNRKWWEYLPGLKQSYEDKLARYQTEYDYWLEKDRRKYDSPAETVERYSEAGLSPMLAYGNISPGSASQGAGAKVPQQVPGVSLTEGLNQVIDTKYKLAQIGETTARARLIATQADAAGKEYEYAHTPWQKFMERAMDGDYSGMTPYQAKRVEELRNKMQSTKNMAQQERYMQEVISIYKAAQIFGIIGNMGRTLTPFL